MRQFRIALAAAVIGAMTLPGAARAAQARAMIEGVDDQALRAQLEQAVGDEPAPPVSRLEARRRARDAAEGALALLRSEGYYAAEIEPDIGEGDQPTSVVRVRPGPRFVLGDTRIEWIGSPPSLEAGVAAIDSLNLPPGAPARAASIVAAEARLLASLQLYGYAGAEAQPREVIVDHADETMRPNFRIAAGDLVRLGAVQVESAGHTRPAWVAGLAPWEEGRIYRPDLVAEFERRLLDAAVYDQVTVALSAQTDANGRRPVVVSLAERSRQALEVSTGYSTTVGGDIDLRWSHFNRLGRADTLSFQTRYAEIGSRYGVDLTLPHWSAPGRILRLTAEAFRDNTVAFDQAGYALRGDLTRRWGRFSYLTFGGALIRTRVNDKHTGAVDLALVKGLVALVLDRSNNPLDPSAGWKLEARAEPTAMTGDQGLFYLRSQVQGSTYLAFDEAANTVGALRLRLGSVVGGQIPNVPAFDRFYAGGGGSVRGYGFQRVGPRYPDGDPQGGLSLFEASLELRHRFGRRFGGVAFFDAGSVGGAVNPNFGDVSFAAGLGLRYNLDFAPIRVDFAVPLDRRPGDAAFQIYVSIGQSF